MEKTSVRRSWRRRVIVNALIVLSVWALIEGGSLVAMVMFLGLPGQLAKNQQTTARQNPFQPGGNLGVPNLVHPYLGEERERKEAEGQRSIDGRDPISHLEFVDEGPPPRTREPGRVIIGILGGSVAKQMSQNATETLARELAQSDVFAGRSFRFVRMAGDGYRQPQQLFTLNYMLALGADFDIIINLDGVNEASLSVIDNVSFGAFAAYPRDWVRMIAGNASPEFSRRAGYVSYLHQQQRDEARWFQSFPWKYSPTALLLWGIRKDRSDQTVQHQLLEMGMRNPMGHPVGESEPPKNPESPQQIYQQCTDLWVRSSILQHQICASRGIRYYHFLQPNQYLPESKPIGPEEAAVAIKEGSSMCVAIRTCFPLMQAQAARFAEAGVSFADLTGVFAEHPESIYRDDCCHIEPTGDQIMATAIASHIKRIHAARQD